MGEGKGIIATASRYSVTETLGRLIALLDSKHITVFATIDHSGEAQKAGLEMRPTKLLIFGNPRGGTPLMIASPTLAIDLPLKALIWEDSGGKTWLSYNSVGYLADRFGMDVKTLKALDGLVKLMEAAVR